MNIPSLSFPLKPITLSPNPKFNTNPKHKTHNPNLKIPKPGYKTTKNSHKSPQIKDPNFCTKTHKASSTDVLCFMDVLGITVTPDIYASLVAECTRNRNRVRALELLTHMKRNRRMIGYLNRRCGSLLLNRILVMLVSCGCLDVARQLFDEMPHRDSISLAVMIAGFVDNEVFDQGLGLFVEMYGYFMCQSSGLTLRVVLVCVLEACVQLKDVGFGKAVHGWLVKMGFCAELFVGTALMEFYVKFRCLSEANLLFYERIRTGDRCHPDLWTDAVVYNVRGRRFVEVLEIFREMGKFGVRKNEYVLLSVLRACGRVNDEGSFGRQVHASAIKLGLGNHVLVMRGLVDMYGRRGLLNDARNVFDIIRTDKRNSACWNAMVKGFLQHGLYVEAIKMFYQMKSVGLQPHESLINEVRLACGSGKVNACMSNIESEQKILDRV